MKYEKIVLKLGRGGISLLTKMKLMKKPEKWLKKWDGVVEKYHKGFERVRRHKGIFWLALLLNVLQRVSQVMITYFVIAAVHPNVNVVEIFAAQAFVTLGYNSIPLPGGVGAFELLYLNTYRALGFGNHFVVVAVMITRLISYYSCMLLSGGYTLIYHLLGGKKKISPAATERADESAGLELQENSEQSLEKSGQTNEIQTGDIFTETTPQEKIETLKEEKDEIDQ